MKKLFLYALLPFAAMFIFAADAGFSTVNLKLIKMEDKYYLFLSDVNGNAYPNKNITASGKSDAPELFKPNIPMTPFADNGFVLNKEPGNFKSLKITMENRSSNETIYPIFANSHEEQGGYLCPMHPDKFFNSEGKCPKCQMPLVTRKISVYSAPQMGTKQTRKEKFALN